MTWLYVVKGDDGGPALAKLGHYEDELVRTAQGWRFTSRKIFNEMTGESPKEYPAYPTL